MELTLKYRNNKIVELVPVSFNYSVTYKDQPQYYDTGEFAGYKTDHYSNVDISKLWDVQRTNNPMHQINFENFNCQIQTEFDRQYLHNTVLSYSNAKISPRKCDVVSEGELKFIDKPTKTNVLGIVESVSDMKFILHNCLPTYIDDDVVGIQSDFIETYINK